MKIKHIHHREIDKKVWDNTIKNAKNSRIYALSWYLDCVSPNWEALVSENYEFVMPLPVKTKFGLKYIVQPILTQQLGVFSSEPLTESIIKEFRKSIPYFSYEMNLNENNYVEDYVKRPNLVLNLSVGYESLVKNFSVNTLRNIKKAENNNLRIDWNLNYNDFFQFYYAEEKHYNLPDKGITEKLVTTALEHKQIMLIGSRTREEVLVAVLGLFISGNRLIYLLPSSSKKGKDKSAMFFVINEIIKKFARTETILDFEGSKIEGVARFYKGFGAKHISYYMVKRFRPKILIKK